MVDAAIQDLYGLDRDVARAATELARWRTSLASTPDDAAREDPFDGLRHVASRSTWVQLGELAPSVADEPLRAALRRWVHALVMARVGAVDDLASARDAAALHGKFGGPRPRLVSWREAWRGVAVTRPLAEVRLWLEAAADAGASLAPIERRRAERRVEIARRMGVDHPWEGASPVGPARLRASAARFLARTDDLSRAVWAESLETDPEPAAVFQGAVAREAGDGWPAHLTPRWLDETFGACARGLAIALPALPQAAGAASFARALSAFGFAVRVASSQSSMPFSLAREPGFVAAHRLAAVFGALSADPEFQVRALGVSRRPAGAQARLIARSVLFEARLTAARILLGHDVAPPRDLFEDLTMRLLGAPLDPRLRGAWPTTRHDEPARWVGLVQAPALRRSLRDEFDTDWFRNPRAWTHLRSTGAGPAYEPVDENVFDGDGDALVRFFEDALG